MVLASSEEPFFLLLPFNEVTENSSKVTKRILKIKNPLTEFYAIY